VKLTNYMRDAFVTAVLQDVPQTDYHVEMEKEVRNDVIRQLPPKVAAVYDDTELHRFLTSHYFHEYGISLQVPGDRGWCKLSPAAVARLELMKARHDAQAKMLADLRSKLRGVAYACTTLKALAATLPEFEKYMPKDEPTAVRSLPVVANVVSDFMKAGWPKGKVA
jgi:hypothetical protein